MKYSKVVNSLSKYEVEGDFDKQFFNRGLFKEA